MAHPAPQPLRPHRQRMPLRAHPAVQAPRPGAHLQTSRLTRRLVRPEQATHHHRRRKRQVPPEIGRPRPHSAMRLRPRPVRPQRLRPRPPALRRRSPRNRPRPRPRQLRPLHQPGIPQRAAPRHLAIPAPQPPHRHRVGQTRPASVVTRPRAEPIARARPRPQRRHRGLARPRRHVITFRRRSRRTDTPTAAAAPSGDPNSRCTVPNPNGRHTA